MNILLLGFAFAVPYHVMRCAAAAGHRVTLLGNGPAHALLRSRRCADLYLSDFDYRSKDYRILTQEVAHLAIAIGFDLVMASDDVSTRALAAIREEIPLPSTALAPVEVFDTLNSKARFAHFCVEHGLPFGDHVEITGERLGISMLCERGKILAHIVEERSERYFHIRDNADLAAAAARLVEATRFDGVAHCDAVIDRATGLAHLTRCRPGFSASIVPAMIAGINFADAMINLSQGVAPPRAALPPAAIRLYPAAIRTLATPWRLSRNDWRLLAYHLREHELHLAERLKRIDESEVAVRAMEEDAPPPTRLAS